MRLLRLFLLLSIVAPSLRAEWLSITETLPSPAPTDAQAPELATDGRGHVWLTWVEGTQFRAAAYRDAEQTWSAAITIAADPGLVAGSVDRPKLVVTAQGLTAIWYVNTPAGDGYAGHWARSTDEGATWSPPQPLSTESAHQEFVALTALPDGRVLAAWLDPRQKNGHAGDQALYSRILGEAGTDELIDARVCDCCPLALLAFPDGTALVAYRDRSATEVRDIARAHRIDGQWSTSEIVAQDDWQINGCPVNGISLARQGAYAAITWFTGARDQPRVRATVSSSAGLRWQLPATLDAEAPRGRVNNLFLHNGDQLVTWLAAEGQTRLALLTGEGNLTAPYDLPIPPSWAATKVDPRLALLADRVGFSPRALLLSGSGEPGASFVVHEVTLLSQAGAADCGCGKLGDPREGYGLRGTVTEIGPDRLSLTLQQPGIPGLEPAGPLEVQLFSPLPQNVEIGRAVLGNYVPADAAGTTGHLVKIRLLGKRVGS